MIFLLPFTREVPLTNGSLVKANLIEGDSNDPTLPLMYVVLLAFLHAGSSFSNLCCD